MFQKNICPYCNNKLDKIPKRKKKCPHCGNYIYIRNRKMVTENEAEKIDFIKYLEMYGISEKYYNQTEKKLTKKFGSKPPVRDIKWSICNQLISQNPRNFEAQKMIYYDMALMLDNEGKNSFHLLEQARRAELLEYQSSGLIKKVKILTAGKDNACSECLKLDGKVFTIEKALKEMPLPNKNCTNKLNSKNSFCRCSYLSVI